MGGQSTPWHSFPSRPTFLLSHTLTLLHSAFGGLPITPSASWSHSWDHPLHTPLTPCLLPPQLSPHPACLSQDGDRHKCSHTQTCTHTQSQTFESDFWPISSPKIPTGRLSCVSVSRLCLWVGPAAFLQASVFSSAGNLSPHTPTRWSWWQGTTGKRVCGSGGSARESPLLPSQREPHC